MDYNVQKANGYIKDLYKHLAIAATAWKVSKYEVISGPCFPVFGQNKEIDSLNLRIQSK